MARAKRVSFFVTCVMDIPFMGFGVKKLNGCTSGKIYWPVREKKHGPDLALSCKGAEKQSHKRPLIT